MIPLECACSVPLLRCLRNFTLELRKERTHHSWVKSRGHMLRCSACGGPTIKIYALRIWFATLICLSRGYARPPARLSSLYCMLYFTFSLCIWGARLCLCNDSSHVFALFEWFLFFFNGVCPQDSTPQGAPTDINVYGGNPYMEIEGALHVVLVHILCVEVSPKTAVLVVGIEVLYVWWFYISRDCPSACG